MSNIGYVKYLTYPILAQKREKHSYLNWAKLEHIWWQCMVTIKQRTLLT